MGREARCRATYEGRSSEGKALLESEELIFRGDFRFSIPFKKIERMEVVDGRLRVNGAIELDLGAEAENWASRIRNPPSLLDKLGVKAGSRIALDGLEDRAFLALLEQRGARLSRTEADLLLLLAETKAGLRKLKPELKRVKQSGALWIVYPKGGKETTEAEVLAAGRAAGLVDSKVASFSPTHTALKFTRRKA